MKSAFWTVSFLILTIAASAQHKYEREVRVREQEVPASARQMLEQLNPDSKTKWYKEYGKDQISFEAKTTKAGKKFSIEFSADGAFEDIETTIKTQEVPDAVLQPIQAMLQQTFTKYRIDKIQVQHGGTVDAVIGFVRSQVASPELVVHYELVVSAKEQGAYGMFEYLFDARGTFVQRQKIMLSNTENLEN